MHLEAQFRGQQVKGNSYPTIKSSGSFQLFMKILLPNEMSHDDKNLFKRSKVKSISVILWGTGSKFPLFGVGGQIPTL